MTEELTPIQAQREARISKSQPNVTVGKTHVSQFKKHIDSPNEWAVVTDKNLKVLSAKEAGWNVPSEVQNKAFAEARSRLPEGEHDVYFFHSHPRTGERSGINTNGPSKGDLVAAGREQKGAVNRGLNIRAYGVMSQHGVDVFKIPYGGERNEEIPAYFDNQQTIRGREEAELRGITKDNYRNKSHRDFARLIAASSNQAFKDTKEKYPEIETGHIRREILRPSDIRSRRIVGRRLLPKIEWDQAKKVYIGDLPEDEQKFIRSLQQVDDPLQEQRGKYKPPKTKKTKDMLDNRIDDVLFGNLVTKKKKRK